LQIANESYRAYEKRGGRGNRWMRGAILVDEKRESEKGRGDRGEIIRVERRRGSLEGRMGGIYQRIIFC